MEPRRRHSSCVRFGKIVTPHTYRDSHATADGNVLKDISLTRRVVNYEFRRPGFFRRRLAYSVLGEVDRARR